MKNAPSWMQGSNDFIKVGLQKFSSLQKFPTTPSFRYLLLLLYTFILQRFRLTCQFVKYKAIIQTLRCLTDF